MTQRERFKRGLLREVVRENLEMIHGQPRRAVRRGRGGRHRLLRGLRLVGVPTVLLVAISALLLGWSQDGGPAADTPPVAPRPVHSSYPAPRPFNPVSFPLGVKKVVIDPGHGGRDPGAPTPFGLWEKDITLDVARRLQVLLHEASLFAVLTRETDETVSLRDRAHIANREKGDLFVSIHFNAHPQGAYRGVETYYLGPTDDPDVERLAGVENRASGYSLADFRQLLEGVYTHVRQQGSRAFAQSVHREFVLSLSQANPSLRDNGVKTAPFLVLVATEMPGILAEVSVLSNAEDARLVATPSYRQQIARSLFEGIRAHADARNWSGKNGSP